MKTLESSDDYSTRPTSPPCPGRTVHFSDAFHLKFGVRDGIRDANNDGYTLVAPVCRWPGPATRTAASYATSAPM
jgi:hypothetical protein